VFIWNLALTLSEEHRLSAFENLLLRTSEDETSKNFRHRSFAFLDYHERLTGMLKSQGIKCETCDVSMNSVRNAKKAIFTVFFKRNGHLMDLVFGEKLMIKCGLKL
jgi:hypothetical protein